MPPSPSSDLLSDRLRVALAEQAQARIDLTAARESIDKIIEQMRRERRPWRRIAGYVPQSERSREAHRLRARAYRCRHVTRGDRIRRAGDDLPGIGLTESSPSPEKPQKEKEPMNTPRLIKRRTTTTEELFDDRHCPVPDIDDDDDGANVDDERGDEAAKPTRAAHGRPHDEPTVKGAETAGTDGEEFEGDDDR